MAKEELLTIEGVVDEILPDGRFGVLLDNQYRISNGGGLAYAGLLLSVTGLLTVVAVMISGHLERRRMTSVVQEPAMHRA